MRLRSSMTTIAVLTVIALTPSLAISIISTTFSKDYVGMSTSQLASCTVDGKEGLCQPDMTLVIEIVPIGSGVLCYQLTGVNICDGVMGPPRPTARMLFDPTPIEQHL